MSKQNDLYHAHLCKHTMVFLWQYGNLTKSQADKILTGIFGGRVVEMADQIHWKDLIYDFVPEEINIANKE